MTWQALKSFRDPSVPKLNNLQRAAKASLRVPATVWAPARLLATDASPQLPFELGPCPWIIRSGSPTEDTRRTSNAGQLLSLPLHDAKDFTSSLRRVVDALPPTAHGVRQGYVFVQPLVNALEAGVAFFDGFYYERTQARGKNEGLTSGQDRGEVKRGHLARGDAWSDWLGSIYRVFGQGKNGDARLDVEFARDEHGYILLQVRPALFPIRRNPTLSLANHKEILGDPPSPWLVAALVEAGKDLSFPALADPAIRGWDETYAIEVGARAWLNVSFWFRWMDHFGLPRSLVTEGVGGSVDGDADRHLAPARFAASIPSLLRFQWNCLRLLLRLEHEFRPVDAAIDRAESLADLHAAAVEGLKLALRGNFAINSVLSGVSRIRRALHLPGTARIVTQEMMEAYRQLALLPAGERAEALDRWLETYGHRGPLESDLARPRFHELRDVLLADILSSPLSPVAHGSGSFASAKSSWRWQPFFLIDERREWFRDAMMRRWDRLRSRILAEARRLVSQGKLRSVEDVFWLTPSDLDGALSLAEAAVRSRTRVEAVQQVDLPTSAPRDVIEDLLMRSTTAQASIDGRAIFPGISLNAAVMEGRALKADDLVSLLRNAGELGQDRVLVVPTLEPSWAVVFPRVGGVISELGGELSHASILLREARRPAIVNCAGIFRRVHTGDRLRLDGARGVVEILE